MDEAKDSKDEHGGPQRRGAGGLRVEKTPGTGGGGGLSKICERHQHSFVTSQGDVFKNQVGPFSEICKNESNKND